MGTLKMADKNEEKRYKLWREIVKIEDKEESLLAIKRQYEKQLTNFYSDIQVLNCRMTNLLELSPSSHKIVEQIEEDNWSIQRAIGWYVDEELDDLDKQTKKARRLLDDVREELVTERNRLPWE